MSDGLRVRAVVAFEAVGRPGFRLEVDVQFPAGISAVLGPSGSGKTTLLGVIAGRRRPMVGRVQLDGQVLLDTHTGVDLTPARRGIGYVFQEYHLFPHLTALENVCFGLRGGSRGRRIALEWLERLGISALAHRHPGTLSGGEQQRIALARALAPGPGAVLLDEPVAALDAGARAAMLDAIRRAQRESAVPFVHVCHSPAEAARIADRALVLSAGRVVQEGEPLEVLNAPRSLAVARVAGFENVLAATVVSHHPQEGVTIVDAGGARLEMGLLELPEGSPLDVALRAEDVILAREAIRGTSARNVLPGTVLDVRVDAGRAEVEVAIPAPVRVSVTPATVADLDLRRDARVYLLIKARSIHRLEDSL